MRKRITWVCMVLPCLLVAQINLTTITPECVKEDLAHISHLRKQAAYQDVLNITDELLHTMLQDSVQYDTLIADLRCEQAMVYYYLQKYEKCKPLFKEVATVYEQFYGDYAMPLVRIYNNLANAAYLQGDVIAASDYFDKAEVIMDSLAADDDPYWPVLYTNVGNYYFKQYDVDNALLYYEKSLAMEKALADSIDLGLLIDYFNIGFTYSFQSNYDAALKNYNQAREIFEKGVTRDSFFLSMILCNTGDCYFKTDQLDAAYDHYQRSLQPLLNKIGYTSLKSRIYRALGKYHMAIGNFDKSVELFHQSLFLNQQDGNFTPEIIFDCYRYLALAYSGMGNKQLALAMLDRAYHSIGFREDQFSFWNMTFPKAVILDGINTKVSILLKHYELAGDTSDLNQAHRANALSLQVIDSITTEIKEKTSTRIVIDKMYDVYENALKIHHRLFQITNDAKHIDLAFLAAEKSKSSLLLNEVLKSKATRFSNISPSVLQTETQLKQDISLTEKQLRQLLKEPTNDDPAGIETLRHRLLDLKQDLQDFIEQLETNHPDYYALKYKSDNTGINAIQHNLLEDQEALLEFFVGSKNVYGIAVNKNSKLFVDLGPTDSLDQLVRSYCNLLYHYNPFAGEQNQGCQQYAYAAHDLYLRLVHPFGKLLRQHTTIIPDGFLTYLPFDALVQSAPTQEQASNCDLGYLLNTHTISYNYSAELMLEMASTPLADAKNELLAVAPSFGVAYAGERLRSDDLAPLSNNIPEVEALMQHCQGTTLIDKQATKEQFLQLAGQYRAIHLATHGKANNYSGAYSYLAFTHDGTQNDDEHILFALDIYNLDLAADLVVLSACETALGEWKRGEGMISLARAFSYAGAKHIITTLWKVADSKASGIMKDYYKHLQKGLGKSTALRQAKLDYLAQQSPTAHHPFFWASFISVGQDGPIVLDGAPLRWALWIAPLVVAVLGFVFYNYFVRKTKLAY